jgi:glutamine synthetase
LGGNVLLNGNEEARMDRLFSPADLARRTEEARPIIERLMGSGCRFAQVEVPDNNGTLRGRVVPLGKGLSPSGAAVGKIILAVKGDGSFCMAAPFANIAKGGGKAVAVPDLSTAVALPWKRDVAGVLCDLYMDDGSPCPLDARYILRSAEGALRQLNYSARVALEYEVYIFERNEALMQEGRFGELTAFGRDRDFYSILRSPSFEDLAKEFMTRCEAAGIHVEAFHTEYGHGMFEYTFTPQTPLKAADDAVRAKLYLKQLCSERGLIACYMAAKSTRTDDTFCGCHHNFSLARGAKNEFWDESSRSLSQVGRYAAAGILETLPPFTLIYHPWVNSFRRTDHHMFTPEEASWGDDNGYCSIRVVYGAVPTEMTRFEFRVPGADVNPYLSVAAIVLGCLRGIRQSSEPPPYTIGPPTGNEQSKPLPRTVPEAIDLFRKSPAVADAFHPAFVEHYVLIKQEEWNDFAAEVAAPEQALAKAPVTNWETTRYFQHA